MPTFPQITTPPEDEAEVVVNEALETLEHLATYGKDPSASSLLTWGYYGGRWGGFLVADGTFTLTGSTTNYIVAAVATGVTTCSTSTTNWNNATDYKRVYKITTTTVVTVVEDHRGGPGGVHGSGGGSGGGGGGGVIAWKEPVRAASTGAGTLASSFENGDTLDGVTLATDDRILLKDQASGLENGIYIVKASGAPTRAVDADSGDELIGATVFVSEGTANADTQWTCTTNATISIGATALTFVKLSGGPLTTKGDVFTRSSSADARLAVGANYAHLMADSGTTTGLRWAFDGAVPLAYFGTLNNDGTTDDGALVNTAIASGAKHIDARGLNIAVTTTINLAAGVTLDITGTTITTPGSTTTSIKADTVDDWALIADGASVVGAGTTIGTAKALHVVGCNRYKVRGLRSKNIKGWGFYVQPGSPSGSIRGDQGVFEACAAESCYWGWEDEPGAGAEYTTVRDFRTTGCTIWGTKTCAGSVEWSGGHDVDNVGNGFVMVGGTNHAHGMVTARSVNHNGTYNLSCTGIVNGQTFIGCHFYEKLILLDGCKGVTFVGGIMDIDGAGTIEVNSGTGSGKCRMNGVYFPGDYGQVSISGSVPRTLVAKDCFGAGSPGNIDIETVDISANYSYGIDDEAVHHLDSDTTARDLTVPANGSVPYPIGKVLSGTNGTTAAGTLTLKTTSDTTYWAPSMATGDRTLATGAAWAIKKIASTKWVLTGVGIT